MPKPRILVAGLNQSPNQLTRFVEQTGGEAVTCETPKYARQVRFDGSCDALILCSAHISHTAHEVIRQHYRDEDKPIFMPRGGASVFSEDYAKWILSWPKDETTQGDDTVSAEPKMSQPMSASVPLLIERVGKLEEAVEHLTDTIISAMAKVESANPAQINELVSRAFKYDDTNKELMAALLAVPERKRKRRLPCLICSPKTNHLHEGAASRFVNSAAAEVTEGTPRGCSSHL